MIFPNLIDTITILKPMSGQSQALVEHLENLIVHTFKRGDQDVLCYELFQILHEDEQLHVRTTYQDQHAINNHHQNRMYKDTMNFIQDEGIAIVKLKEIRCWPYKSFTRFARVGSELLECVKCGKKKASWGPSEEHEKSLNRAARDSEALFGPSLKHGRSPSRAAQDSEALFGAGRERGQRLNRPGQEKKALFGPSSKHGRSPKRAWQRSEALSSSSSEDEDGENLNSAAQGSEELPGPSSEHGESPNRAAQGRSFLFSDDLLS